MTSPAAYRCGLTARELTAALKVVLPAVSADEARPRGCTVAFAALEGPDRLELMSTDTYRIHRTAVPVDKRGGPGPAGPAERVAVLARPLAAVRHLARPGDRIEIALDDSGAEFRANPADEGAPDGVLSVRAVEGGWFSGADRYVEDPDPLLAVTVVAADLAAALTSGKAARHAHADLSASGPQGDGGRLAVTVADASGPSGDQDAEVMAAAELAAYGPVEPFAVRLNARWLGEAVAAVRDPLGGPKQTVRLAWSGDDADPVLATALTGWRHRARAAVMPRSR